MQRQREAAAAVEEDFQTRCLSSVTQQLYSLLLFKCATDKLEIVKLLQMAALSLKKGFISL